ncbi:putative calcium-binding protein [Arachis hypogaea]|nr:putative calcium-binding protein [Arachis hypogaea]
MVVGQLHCFNEEKRSQSDGNSTPFFGFKYVFLFCTVYNIINEFISALWFFLLPQIHYGNSNTCFDEKLSSGPEICHNEPSGFIDFGKLERDHVKMEPSLEELKDAFDVFHENKDGFIDASELQRVLRILRWKEAREHENC